MTELEETVENIEKFSVLSKYIPVIEEFINDANEGRLVRKAKILTSWVTITLVILGLVASGIATYEFLIK